MFNVQNALFPCIVSNNIQDMVKRQKIFQKNLHEDTPLKDAFAAE